MSRFQLHRLAKISFGAACIGLVANGVVLLLWKNQGGGFLEAALLSPWVQVGLLAITVITGAYAFFRFWRPEPGEADAKLRVSDLVVVVAAMALGVQNGMTATRWATEAESVAQVGAQSYLARAEAGDAAAQHSLGVCFDEGLGVARDPAEAARWYRRAAEQGFAPSQYNLAYCLEEGEGAAKDVAGALYWYTKAAEQDLQPAQLAAGLIFLDPGGGHENLPKAYVWLTLAAEGEPGEARRRAEHHLAQVKARMTPEQLAQGENTLQARRSED